MVFGRPLAKPGVKPLVAAKPIAKPTVAPRPGVAAKPTAKTTAGKPAAKPAAAKHESAFDAGAREDELARQRKEQRMNRPYSFRLKVGESSSVILLDRAGPNDLFRMYEHRWRGPTGKWDQHEQCLKEEGNCPLCQRLGKDGTFVIYLTCIDLRNYVVKKGPNKGKTIKFGRLLLPIKSSMVKKFQRLYEQHGTFRGLQIKLSRDSDRGTNIGDDVIFEKKISEKWLQSLTEKDEKKVNGEPVDYEKAFPKPSMAELRKRFGGTGEMAGSADFDDGDVPDEEADEIPF